MKTGVFFFCYWDTKRLARLRACASGLIVMEVLIDLELERFGALGFVYKSASSASFFARTRSAGEARLFDIFRQYHTTHHTHARVRIGSRDDECVC